MLRCIHLVLCNNYKSSFSWIYYRNTSRERIKIDILIKNNKSDIFIYNKKRNNIILIKLGIIKLKLITSVKNEKFKNYDLLVK